MVAQFDVCSNLGQRRAVYPYFVVVQSNEFAAMKQRVVVPMTTMTALYPRSYAPHFQIAGIEVVADPLLMFSIPTEKLGERVLSLAEDDAVGIMSAIDRVLSSAYRS
ncbi:CcdB family protein [Acidisphaera sp. L21]|uniref:CcdB family protein n=1 Tax=Acidisphaera sp. L21 TaxID=1641851 RepID=UPI00131A6FD5|nr:CcdB family protein [Acidisphaera sp. L21]